MPLYTKLVLVKTQAPSFAPVLKFRPGPWQSARMMRKRMDTTHRDRNEPLILYGRDGEPVYVPPELADLFRDLPKESEEPEEETGKDLFDSKYKPEDWLEESPEEEEEEAEEVGHDRLEVVVEGQIAESFGDDSLLLSFWEQFKSNGGKLVPFVKTLAIYFLVMGAKEDKPSWTATAVKCLPILSLALFVLLHGVSHPERHQYSRRILASLIFSCVGDAFLIWPGYFLHGMAAFGAAQGFYISAFGLRPVRVGVGALLYILCSAVIFHLLGPSVMAEPWPISMGVLVYASLLVGTLWRAIARLSRADQEGRWSTACSLLGAFAFTVSDTLLAINMFYTKLPYGHLAIMVTYYLAQFALALSIIRPHHVKKA